MKTTHLVTVLDREISVRSSASAEKVRAIESFANSRLLEIGASLQTSDAQLVLTLALLNTAEELIDLRSEIEANKSLNSKLQEMIAAIEKV